MASKLQQEIYYKKILEKSRIRHAKNIKQTVIKKPVQKEIDWNTLNDFFKKQK